MDTTLASCEHIAEFTTQLLNTGDTVVNILDNLISALVENGADHDEATTDILASLTGTLQARFTTIPAADVIRATELITLAIDSVMEDLRRALARSSQRN